MLNQKLYYSNAHSLVIWVIGLLVSLCPHDTLHVARPAELTGNKSTRWCRQTLRDHGLLNLLRSHNTF